MKILITNKGKGIGIGLDRTVIGLRYPSFPKAEGTPPTGDQIKLVQAKQKEFVANLKHIENVITLGPHHCKSKNKDLKRYYVRSEDDGKHLCIFSLGFVHGTGVINFEFNPSKLGPKEFGEIGGLLCVMFYDHYGELFAQGVVSHAEFYTDIAGEELSNLVLIDSGRRAVKNFKGTTYHGGRGSRLVTTLYDKAKEQKVGGQLVRIEARLNRRDIPFKDLVEHDLFNPFSTSVVVEPSVLQSAAQKWKIPHLANNIKELGLYGAIANKHARKAILAFINERAIPWWQPEIFWAGHRKLLQQLKPGHAGGFA